MKTKILTFLCVYLIFLLFGGCRTGNNEAKIQKQARAMIIAGFEGTKFGDDQIIIQEIKKGLGGVILFDYDVATASATRNIESSQQLKELTAALQAISPQKLIIAIDQEGGRVCRLKSDRGFYCMPSAMELGKQDEPAETAKTARKNAAALADLGINLNFAPVVDVNTNPNNPIIGAIGRSYGSEPQTVIRHSREFIKAHSDYGVKSCIKHFPGHGSSKADSHKGFVDITDTWAAIELAPYEQLISERTVEAVMTAHVFNANLDPDFPGTLSEPIITDLLREQLNFEGLVFSDDMQMGAIADNYGFEFAVVQAINAGVDMLILANNSPAHNDPLIIEKAVNAITEAVKTGKISEKRLLESYLRISWFKQSLK